MIGGVHQRTSTISLYISHGVVAQRHFAIYSDIWNLSCVCSPRYYNNNNALNMNCICHTIFNSISLKKRQRKWVSYAGDDLPSNQRFIYWYFNEWMKRGFFHLFLQPELMRLKFTIIVFDVFFVYGFTWDTYVHSDDFIFRIILVLHHFFIIQVCQFI